MRQDELVAATADYLRAKLPDAEIEHLPQLPVFVVKRGPHYVYLHMRAQRTRPPADEAEMHRKLRDGGVPLAVCHSVKDAELSVERLGRGPFPRRRRGVR